MSASHGTRRFAALHHLVSGGVLALKGFDKLDQGYLYVGAALFALGVLLLAYFAFERFGQHRSRHLAILVHTCEGIAFLFITYLYFVEGKTYLPWATLAAATGLLIAALAHARPSRASFQHRLRVADPAEAGAFFVDVLGFRRVVGNAENCVVGRAGVELRLEAAQPPSSAGTERQSPTPDQENSI